MKFNTMIRSGLAAATSLAVALGFTACSRDYTVAYVYAISASSGAISGYGIDYQSGVLTQLQGSPFATQFTNPVSIISSPSGNAVYAISGNQQAAVEFFQVGTDGKLYGNKTYNITGTYPTAAKIDAAGAFLYVTYKYQTQYSPASPGPGGVTIFPINADGSLGTALNTNVGNNPVAVTVSAPICTSTPIIAGNTGAACTGGQKENVFVYVVDQEASPNAAIIGFAQNTTTGALSLLPGSACSTTAPTVCTGYHAGVTPSAIVSEPTGRYVYVTDKTSNEIFGYQIASSTTSNAGALSALVSSPFTTGLYPVALTVDPRGKYLYTANYNGSSVSSFSINQADGSLGGTASVGNFTTSTGPTCVTVDPSLGQYLYTSNSLDNSISGGQLASETGQLTGIADSPFPTGSLPSCITSVPNGPRANQLYNP
jgi:6-phosphogluconolactonase (cycloisomerase 2 family)